MISWTDLTDRVESALRESQTMFLGTPVGVDPKLGSRIAMDVIRETVEAEIASIPRVPTNKYDVMITAGVLGGLGALAAGFLYTMYKLETERISAVPSFTKEEGKVSE